MNEKYDVIIVGSGPAGLGTAFYLAENTGIRVLIIDRSSLSSGGLRNDCKQNYTYPVGFPEELWGREEANKMLKVVEAYLEPECASLKNMDIYRKRADKTGVSLLSVRQSHVGTDRAVGLINRLMKRLISMGVHTCLGNEVTGVDCRNRRVILDNGVRDYGFTSLVLAPGRSGFKWLQKCMNELGVNYLDNIVDIGVRIEAREENYPIVSDCYDPKFIFPDGVRTFCTNSGAARVVQEKYEGYYSVNGHSFSHEIESSGLVNFAMLKTIRLTDPVVSGNQFADILGQMAMKLSGGQPMMQRIGDFRMGRRSKLETFNKDLYDFKPTLAGATPGDVSLAIPSKIMRHLWKSLKMLDTIVPGILHPSTIIYYPEIKTYANRPEFKDHYFMVKDGIYMIGDGAGTSRGITAAWSSGIRAAMGICSRHGLL